MRLKRPIKAGLPSGSLVHAGEAKDHKIRISVIDYNKHKLQEKEVKKVEECFPFKKTSTVTWINVEGTRHPKVIAQLGEHFELHPLLLEDITNTQQRPKMDDYGSYIFIILKMLSYNEKKEAIVTEQVSIVLGHNFVISFQEGQEGDVFNSVRDRIRNSKGKIRQTRADYLTYMLIDAVVDNYFYILEKVGDGIERLEERIVQESSQDVSHSIHVLKRELIYLRKATWPLRDVISAVQRLESKLIHKSTRFYLRDVYDHTVQVIDTIETFRDILSGLLDVHFSGISNRLNEVMKVLTIIGTIFIPLTFITGIYGMNFDFMPEIGWKAGYFAALGVMAIVAGGMLLFFKKRKWI